MSGNVDRKKVMPEILSNDPVWVYQSNEIDPVSGTRKFVAFKVSDILYLEQCFGTHDTSLDSVEKGEVVCVFLKSQSVPAVHIHIPASFNEMMLRWVNFVESVENA